MRPMLWVFVGGGVGSVARYLVGRLALERLGAGFPYGTFLVNVMGSLLLAFLMQLNATPRAPHSTVLLFLATGVMGGFTTYSTFNWELVRYAQEGRWGHAAGYLVSTLFCCLAGAALGIILAKVFTG